MSERLWIAALAATVGFLVCGPVFAQSAVMLAQNSSGGVDLSPLANNVIAVAVAVLTVAAGVVSKFAVGFLASKTKMTDTAFEKMMADRVSDILLRAIDYAEIWAKTQVADPNSSIRDVRVDNLFVRVAVDYAVKSMPDLIKYFGLTRERIEDMIKSRLNTYVVTPPVDSGKVSVGPTS